MKISITLAQLRSSIGNTPAVNAQGEPVTIPSPLNKLSNASLSATMMFWIGRVADECRTEFERVEKRRVALIEKYRSLKKDDDGKDIPEAWELTKEARIGLEDELAELLEETIEVTAKPLSIDDLEKYSAKLEAVDFNANDMRALDWLIVAVEEAAPSNVESIAEHQAKKEQAA